MSLFRHVMSDREVATILAALRYFQANRDDILDAEMPHFEEIEPLTSTEIDDLCEEINIHTLGTSDRLRPLQSND
ncbi:hypothetical protein [Chamaesiphon sp.]|uniref:hypothetical protein n=1 Tax=Chamaesiphon sp. TaxID=2814140 RepID=UPI0035938199